jgi:hypothetical protein
MKIFTSVLRLTFCIILIGLCTNVNAQKVSLKKLQKAKGIEITYQNLYKGKLEGDNILMTIFSDKVSLRSENNTNNDVIKENEIATPKTYNFFDYATKMFYRYAELPNGEKISSSNNFTFAKDLKQVGAEKFLNFNCNIYRTSVNSNTIDIWVTNDIPFKGTPQAGVGIPDGLVLKIVRNTDMIQQASKIKIIEKEENIFPDNLGTNLDPYSYQHAINQSVVIDVPVFESNTVCFNGVKLSDTLNSGIVYNAGGGSIILKKVKLPDYVNNRSIFVELTQYSEGDAYDRTGSVFMIPTDKRLSYIDAMRDLKKMPYFLSGNNKYHALVSDSEYDVPVELMRFFTGFGVRRYNHVKVPGQVWADSVLYKQEVTALADKLHGEVWIGAYIGNWDGKGHKISLNLKFYPNEDTKLQKVIPLFNTVNYLEQQGQGYPTFLQGDSLRVKFTLNKDVKDAMLIYTTTGHGGWGNGDEFNKKPNTIILDGNNVITFIPWREDCGTYRNWNPCSGNFSNGLSSSDLSRSNWCPGTVTNPEYIVLGDLKAGDHEMVVTIPQGAPEGSSISYWCLSGVLIY